MTFALSALQHLAFSRSMTILLIDHHSKASQAIDLADPVDDLLGSSGKGAVADAVFGLYRPRGQREVKLLGRGRDFDELSFDLRFDAVTGCWQHDAPTLTFPQQAIIDALQKSGPMTAAKIARATEQDRSNSYTRLQELVARNLITFDAASKEYDVP
jgi:RecA-family ATPase